MSLASEDRLLLLSSRLTLDKEAVDQVSLLLRMDLDWHYILEASIAHGIAPLAYKGLKQLGPEDVSRIPSHLAKEWDSLYTGNRARNRRMYMVIGQLAREFGSAGIEVMGLKDAQLAKEVYQDIGLRPMSDVDLLIHQKDYQEAAKCLHGLGFTPLPNALIPYTLKYAWAHHFFRQADGVWLDLQWNILQREWDVYHEGNFDFEIARMWRGAKTMALEEGYILVPKPEDMLFHLCLHLEGHFYSELILFCDIAELIKHYNNSFDWHYFIEIAKKYKSESSVYYVLFLVQRLLGVELPRNVLKQLEPRYFQGSLLGPLYDNLIELHLSLDELCRAASPPMKTLDEFEGFVRRQALGAMHSFKEIDAIASAFIQSGGELIILDGTPSEKVYPDPVLRSLNDIYFVILDRNLEHMNRTLTERGFRTDTANGAAGWHREWMVTSDDPALLGQPTNMLASVAIKYDLNRLLHADESIATSKRDAALKTIKARLVGYRADDKQFPIQINVMPLSPEQILIYVSSRLGGRKFARLFGLCNLLEFFKGYKGSIDWEKLPPEAEKCGVSESVRAGLLLIGDFLERDRIPPQAQRLLGKPKAPPRLLEWARYDPTVWGRYGSFKPSFMYLFTLVSIHDLRGKLEYLLQSMFGGNGRRAWLSDLVQELLNGPISRFHNKPQTTRDFAYWIDRKSNDSG